jgi:hypothetical protein
LNGIHHAFSGQPSSGGAGLQGLGLGDLTVAFSADVHPADGRRATLATTWHATARRAPRPGACHEAVGAVRATVVGLAEAQAAGATFDDLLAALGDGAAPLAALYDPVEGWWDTQLGDAVVSGAALVLGAVALQPAYRDDRLGAALVATVIDTLAVGCDFVVLHPASVDVTGAVAGWSPEAWRRVGLERSLGGLWVLSLRTTRFRDAYRALLGNT